MTVLQILEDAQANGEEGREGQAHKDQRTKGIHLEKVHPSPVEPAVVPVATNRTVLPAKKAKGLRVTELRKLRYTGYVSALIVFVSNLVLTPLGYRDMERWNTMQGVIYVGFMIAELAFTYSIISVFRYYQLLLKWMDNDASSQVKGQLKASMR
jgi:hypothetical protein